MSLLNNRGNQNAFIPGMNNTGMGQLPFGNQLPGNQGQGVGPSPELLQQLFPLIQQLQQARGGMIGNIGQAGGMMGQMGMGTKPMQPPVQAQPPNTNSMIGNSMSGGMGFRAPVSNSSGPGFADAQGNAVKPDNSILKNFGKIDTSKFQF